MQGTGVITDKAGGEYKSDKVFSDLNPADIDALPPEAPHRNVDLLILHHVKKY